MTSTAHEVVITALGVVSPIGIGREAFAASLAAGKSGVREYPPFVEAEMPVTIAADVADFDPKAFVRPRKALKVMSRDIQLAFAAAVGAFDESGLAGKVDPERFGVVFGADMMYGELSEIVPAYKSCMVDGEFDAIQWGKRGLDNMFPLWMLKYLPNMSACQIGIACDARGPTNAVTLSEVSSLLSVAEGMRVIERGLCDAMIVGGAGHRLHPNPILYRDQSLLSHRLDAPESASRPFEAARDGTVNGEGAAAFILESRTHAEARGAPILARVLSYSSRIEPTRVGQPARGDAIRASITDALAQSNLQPDQIGHVNAHGLATVPHDRAEAVAIHDVLGDVPVTAPKSFFGNLGAGAGAVEMVASLLALESGEIPPTLNYERPDPDCPVNVVCEPTRAATSTALLLNQTTMGQAVAVVISRD